MKNRGWIVVGAVAMLLAASGALGSMLVYHGNGDPTVDDSVRDLTMFASYGAGPGAASGRRFVWLGTAASSGSPVSDSGAMDGYAWQIDNHLDATGKSFIFEMFRNDGTTAPLAVNDTGATIVARMKVEYDVNGGAMLRIDDGSATTKNQGSAAWTGAGNGAGGNNPSSVRQFADTTTSSLTPVSGVTDLGGYHIVRMTALGTTANIYIDENPTPVLTSTTNASPFRVIDTFEFGAFGTSARVSISFDYVAVCNEGAFAPEADPAAGSFNAQVNLLALPEPSMLALVVGGLLLAGRRRRQ
jgi:hypothetical protein